MPGSSDIDILEKAMDRLKLGGNARVSTTIADELFATTQRPIITAEDLIKQSDLYLQSVKTIRKEELSKEDYRRYVGLYRQLCKLYANPILISGAQRYGGVRKIFQTFEARFLAVSRILIRLGRYLGEDEATFDPVFLTENEYEKVVNGFNRLVSLYKYKKAYGDLQSGKKFQKSGGLPPIAVLSKRNIKKLIAELKATGDAGRSYGLQPDEIKLFELLVNLPWQCQHATNFFYPIANSGALDSYSELLRHQPDYVSPFSTKGNIDKLGNGGFVFFRLFAGGVNSTVTRYGDSRIIGDLSIFTKIGCVSLHDQLIPLSSAGATRMRWGSRLLRSAETVNINNKTKEKSLRDGIRYSYRTKKISVSKPFSGPKDKVKDFLETAPQSRTVSFTEEMFFGSDIVLGIVLSVIRELRWLRACGFRAEFLKQLYSASEPEQATLLGQLVKSLFRIEAKYPVSLRLEQRFGETYYQFEPLDVAVNGCDEEALLTIDNPDGDARFNVDLSVNSSEMRLGLLKQERYRLEGRLSVLRRLVGRLKKQSDRVLLAQAQARYKRVGEEISVYQQERGDAEAFFRAYDRAFDVSQVRLDKLLFVYEHFDGVLEDGYIDIDLAELFFTPSEKLELIVDEELMALISNEVISFSQLAALSVGELNALAECEDLNKALYEYGYSLDELLKLYRQDPMHLTCLTASDLTDLVLDYAPDIPSILLEYANEHDVDLDWVRNQLCDSDALSLNLLLGYDDDIYDPEPEEDRWGYVY